MMRVHEFEGNIYVIRDRGGSRRVHGCEYATNQGGEVAWSPCVEGVMFKDIEPFATVKEWRRHVAPNPTRYFPDMKEASAT